MPRVVTPATLVHVQQVIRHTTTPSFVSSVPKNYNNYSTGSIKADEWRILSTIFIPIALITLWDDDNGLPCQHLHELDHSMALFQALTILCHYTTDGHRASVYRELVKEWINELYVIHPHTKAHKKQPNVHLSIHLYDFLLLYGPVMSWWTFPYERLIGTLQWIKTNHIVGGMMEQTMLKSYLGGGNIRCWLN